MEFSAYKFSDRNHLGFDAREYSKFKYGSKSIARKFGNLLSSRFIQSNEFLNFLKVSENKDIVITAAPHLFIPTASKALVDYFLIQFNQKLISLDYKSAYYLQTFRETSYNDDYGEMTALQREQAISADSFHIDYSFLQNKFVIFVDDIRITGGHERRIKELINRRPPNIKSFDYMFLYFASLESTSHEDPTIENYLNYNFITQGLLSIDWIIKNEDFQFNTRVVKYILNSPKIEFDYFIQYQSDVFKSTLLYWANGNNYNAIPEFQVNFKTLQKLCTPI